MGRGRVRVTENMMTFDEIAEVMDVDSSTACRLFARAIRKLRYQKGALMVLRELGAEVRRMREARQTTDWSEE